MDDVERLKRHYAGRASEVGDRYHPTKPDVAFRSAELEVAIIRALRRNGLTDVDRLRVLEVGSGGGPNLLRFLRWGFRPENLTGCELLADRHAASREVLPAAVRLVHGDARTLDELGSFDIVLQSTVLSSILDDEVQQGVADAMWRAVRPGGIVMSLDFTVDNPANKDVRGVTRKRLKELFPGEVVAQRVLLAPPIARRIGWHPAMHLGLRAVPFLRTHLLATIRRT